MGQAAAIAQGVGAVANLGSSVNSGIKGNKAAKKLDAAQGVQDQAYMNMMGQGQDALGGVLQQYDQLRASTSGGPAQFTAPGMQGYDFTQPTQLADQGVQNAIDAGNAARVGAREQVSAQSQQLQAGLGGALADRGFGPQSGAAVAALAQNAMSAGQGMAGLERDIMGATQNAAFQGAQMDNANLMQMAGLGSQYNLGMNQLGQQSALNQFNANLGSQGQFFNQQAGLLQGQAGLAQNLLSGALGGMENGLDRRAKGAQQAGAGKGASTSAGLGGLQDMGNTISGKQPGGISPGTGSMSQFGVSF